MKAKLVIEVKDDAALDLVFMFHLAPHDRSQFLQRERALQEKGRWMSPEHCGADLSSAGSTSLPPRLCALDHALPRPSPELICSGNSLKKKAHLCKDVPYHHHHHQVSSMGNVGEGDNREAEEMWSAMRKVVQGGRLLIPYLSCTAVLVASHVACSIITLAFQLLQSEALFFLFHQGQIRQTGRPVTSVLLANPKHSSRIRRLKQQIWQRLLSVEPQTCY